MSESRATDTRPPIIVIEEAVVDKYDLDPLAGWLYVVIVRHINRKNNDAFPGINRLAKLAKMSRASVIRYTKVLEDKGLIEVRRETDETGEKQVNHYRLLSASKVVSESNYPSDYVKLPVVSDSDINQIDINQEKIPASENDAAPELKMVKPEKRQRKPDPIFDAVELYIFDIKDGNSEGGRIAKIANWLCGKYEGKGAQRVGRISGTVEVNHIKQFADHCKSKGINPPLDFVKFVEHWRAWASGLKHGSAYQSVARPEARLHVVEEATLTPALTPEEQRAAVKAAKEQLLLARESEKGIA